MRVDDLRAAHKAALTRDHLRVAVVGEITPDELGPLLDRVFGGAARDRAASFPPWSRRSLSGKTTVIDFDTPQSVVIFGNAGILLDDPDFIPAMLMDYILGGGSFGSRLTEEMRVKRGLTYGVYTYLASGHFGGLYMGSFSSSNERVAEAIQILRAEWARMADRRRDRSRTRQRQALPDRRIPVALRRQRAASPRSCSGCSWPDLISATSTGATTWSRP